MKRSEIEPLLLHKLTESELTKILERITQGFTSNRDEIDHYVSDEKFVSAYTLFYLPTNCIKLDALLGNLSEEIIESLRNNLMIDVGCGPGTFSLPFMKRFPETRCFSYDQSSVMLKQAKSVIEGLLGEGRAEVGKVVPSDFRISNLMFGHSLNEMGLKEGLRLIESHRPETILFMEPGTKQSFSILSEMREKLLKEGYHIHYPCPHEGSCVAREKVDEWCHQYLDVRHEPCIERLCQILKKDRRHMPVTFHVYSKIEKRIGHQSIIFRVLKETKFSWNFQVCQDDGKLLEIEVLKRPYKKKEMKEISAMSAGQVLNYEIDKELSEFKSRAKLV